MKVIARAESDNVGCYFRLMQEVCKHNQMLFRLLSFIFPSSETQGQLVGTTGFSWAKVYYNRATSPWALTLTELVLEAFEFPAFDWPEKYFSGQSAKRTSRCVLTRSCFPHRSPQLRGPFKGGF